MILSIDRVLQLLAEGKDINKIADNSNMNSDQVAGLIEDARRFLNKHEYGRIRKKVIIKKKKINHQRTDSESSNELDIFDGAEFTAVPLESNLHFFIAVCHTEQFFKTGIIITDSDEKQIGKMHFKIEEQNSKMAILSSIDKAIEVGAYFKAKSCKFRISDDNLKKIIAGDISTDDKKIQKEADNLRENIKKHSSFIIESVSEFANDKAIFLASQKIKNYHQQR